MVSRKNWDEHYTESKAEARSLKPFDFLADNIDLLPKGKALDIAMGEGRNAVFLAEHGFEVTGVDSSEVAVNTCNEIAAERGLDITTIVADLSDYSLPKGAFDVVVNCNYLQRDLIDSIKLALRVGGVVVFETLNTEHLKFNPDINPDFLLLPGELLESFGDFVTLVYREGVVTNPETNRQKSVSSLIARKIRRA